MDIMCERTRTLAIDQSGLAKFKYVLVGAPIRGSMRMSNDWSFESAELPSEDLPSCSGLVATPCRGANRKSLATTLPPPFGMHKRYPRARDLRPLQPDSWTAMQCKDSRRCVPCFW